jgi:hypothetical protein
MTKDEILNMEARREMNALVLSFTHKETQLPIPYYSTDMNDAWKLVERIRMRYRFINIFTDKKEKNWHCHINKKIDKQPFIAVAPTAPLAICRAALLAMMEAE